MRVLYKQQLGLFSRNKMKVFVILLLAFCVGYSAVIPDKFLGQWSLERDENFGIYPIFYAL
jgi:hypothetical protein